ncbi:hypothetical protein Tco_0672645 [Tanacetum coccineum]
MKFADAVEGKHNVLADSLSRLVNSCVIVCIAKEKEPQMKMITRAAAKAVDKILTKEDALENEDNLHEEEEELPYPKFKREVERILLGNESCFHLDEDEEIPYPKFKREVERIMANEVAYLTESSTSVYNPPEDSVMGPLVYPPSAGNYQQYDGSQS